MSRKLTQEMADEFNAKMALLNSTFRVLKTAGNDYAWEVTLPPDPFEKHRPMIYPNKEFYKLLEEHYSGYELKLTYNNTGDIFWQD